MNSRDILFVIALCFLQIFLIHAQEADLQKALAKKYLYERGEVIFEFEMSDPLIFNKISQIISIDIIKSGKVRAYADRTGFMNFLEFNLIYNVLTPPGISYKSGIRKTYYKWLPWQTYPTYQQYDSIMNSFTINYPQICTLDTFGYSVEGRMLLALKISDNVEIDESEPEFMYSSTMHVDETGGMILMLRFADYLLSNYGVDTLTTQLVDQAEVWINPLANPDGMHAGGDSTITGATRFNANYVDLNRNFPDPEDGEHPDGKDYQPETIAMIEFMSSHNFTMSANFHSGAEVVNYPWDTWNLKHADDNWFQFVSHEYADTVQEYSNDYMNGFNDGITNGYEWYSISGGRQDYITYFLHGRETTIELDNNKITPENQLDQLWNYNYRSLVNYARQSIFGINGFVTDSETGSPLKSKVEVINYDYDNSMVFSDARTGFYVRLLKSGMYDLRFSSEGYIDEVIPGVEVIDFQKINIDVELTVQTDIPKNQLWIFPNPATDKIWLEFYLTSSLRVSVEIYDAMGTKMFSSEEEMRIAGKHIIPLNIQMLPKGVFVIAVKGDNLNLKNKFIKIE